MKNIVFLSILTLFFACKNDESKSEKLPESSHSSTLQDVSFAKGTVIKQVKLTANPNHSFALYLPLSYSAGIKYPVMIFFDPHGSGAYAIEQYTKLSESYQCILVASNDSKNGLAMNETYQIAAELVSEIPKMLSVDETKIIFSGFSGGARVAISAATQLNAISKVVYCGATYPIQQCNHQLKLLGFAGVRDMNYSEMVSFAVGQFPPMVKNYCIEWYGKHEWPDEKIFEKAFCFLNGDMSQITPTQFGEQKLNEIAKEQITHQQYIEGLHNYDVNYWAKEIFKLNQQRLTDKSGTADRLLSFISLACYSLSNQMIQQNLMDQAGKILTIYKMVDPTNSDCDLLQAVYYAKQNNSSKVYNILKMAYSNGLKDFSKIESEPAFAPFLQTPEMNQLKKLMEN